MMCLFRSNLYLTMWTIHVEKTFSQAPHPAWIYRNVYNPAWICGMTYSTNPKCHRNGSREMAASKPYSGETRWKAMLLQQQHQENNNSGRGEKQQQQQPILSFPSNYIIAYKSDGCPCWSGMLKTHQSACSDACILAMHRMLLIKMAMPSTCIMHGRHQTTTTCS